jgi:hypothetical protein
MPVVEHFLDGQPGNQGGSDFCPPLIPLSHLPLRFTPMDTASFSDGCGPLSTRLQEFSYLPAPLPSSDVARDERAGLLVALGNSLAFRLCPELSQ